MEHTVTTSFRAGFRYTRTVLVRVRHRLDDTFVWSSLAYCSSASDWRAACRTAERAALRARGLVPGEVVEAEAVPHPTAPVWLTGARGRGSRWSLLGEEVPA